jgi:hypothetical protein
MDPERIIREGELTEDSLLGALLAEERDGRRPTQLAVASAELETKALRILHPHAPLDALRSSLPNVVLDGELPAGAWELRAA